VVLDGTNLHNNFPLYKVHKVTHSRIIVAYREWR